MNYLNKIKNNTGFTIIEVLIACSIISVSMFALMQTTSRGILLSDQALRKSQASLILEEGAEAVKSIRDNNWTDISNKTLGSSYHLYFNTTTKLWVLDGSTTNLSGYIPSYPIDSIFDRTIIISAVNRDSNDDITLSGGTVDPRTKKITVTVTWPFGGSSISRSLSFYISDIFN
jgi:Tfp pilus assembly protein PilV